MSFKIFRLDELNLDNFFFQSPRKVELLNSQNAILIPMIYKDEEAKKILPILFQLPSIKLNDSYRKDDILLVPINPINSNKTETMKTVLNNIDNKLINDFKLNGKKWCKEVIQNLKNIEYKAIVNEIDDDDIIYENGVLSLSLLTNNNLKIYNEKKELIDRDDYGKVLIKGTIIQSIIELKGLMITLNDEDNEIYPLLKVHQIRYIEEKMLEVNLDNYSILDSDIEVVKQYTNTVRKNQMNLTVLEKELNEKSEEVSSDEESDEEDENEEELLEESDDSDETSSDSDDEILKKISKNMSSSEESSEKNKKKVFSKGKNKVKN